MHHAEQPVAEPVGDPDVALAVDCEAAAIVADLEILDLAWIGRGEPRNVVNAAVADPNPVLLIDAQMEWRAERLARLGAIALADDSALGQVALREEDELALLHTQNPHVAARMRGQNVGDRAISKTTEKEVLELIASGVPE